MHISIIRDLCGISCIHAKYLEKLFGIESQVSTIQKFDYGGVAQYYGADIYNCSSKEFIFHMILKSRKSDIIHLHTWDNFIETLRDAELFYRITRQKKHRKPIILQYHGTDIRNLGKQRQRYWEKADHILVNSKDLLEDVPDATYIPLVVDTELFKPMRKHNGNDALYYIKGNWNLGEELTHPFKTAEKLGLNLSFLHKSAYTIPYIEMPAFLNLYDYLIDINYVHVTNRIALEALACGLKIVNWKDEILNPPLPPQHYPENIAKELMKIYEESA